MRLLLLIPVILLVCLLVFIALLALWSPGKPEPFLDENGRVLAHSVSEKIRVGINGVDQLMFIKSRDTNNPVLLYLHGGMPDYFLSQNYPTGLEQLFTVVWWEQRGWGVSSGATARPDTVTPEQLISDILALTHYLRQRFGKAKIYLMGHSGGTFLGVQAANAAPELYYAYIGVAQMSDQLESERLAYEFMLRRFKETGDTKMARKLEAAPVTRAGGTPAAYLALRDIAMHRLGIGTMHRMRTVFQGIFLPTLQFREYTLAEKVNLWRTKARSGVSLVWDKILATDLRKTVPELQLPVYFLHGKYDYTCSYPLAKSYFEVLQAPVKGFYTFEHSAHSPMFEEPEKMRWILKEDVLTGGAAHADP